MKDFIFMAAAAFLAVMTGCGNDIHENENGQKPVKVTVTAYTGEKTKAVSSYLDSKDYEKNINRLQYFFFDRNTKGLLYYDNSGGSSSSFTTVPGSIRVWAVANGRSLSDISSMSGLENYSLQISENKTDPEKGFVMSGYVDIDIDGSEDISRPVEIKRYLARVALRSIKNSMPANYGSITIDYIFLSNVVGNQNIRGDAEPKNWFNKQGRDSSISGHAETIIDGSNYFATPADLTFKKVGTTLSSGQSLTEIENSPYLFYTYPNYATGVNSGYTAEWTPERSVLVVVASIKGKRYFYPVTLDGDLERNKSYSVGLEITGLGSDDPNKPVSRNNVNINVTIAEWDGNVNFDEVL